MKRGKILLLKSRILGSGIGNTAQEVRNLLTIRIQNPSSSDKGWNPESTAWNPDSKSVLDFLTRRELFCKYQFTSIFS